MSHPVRSKQTQLVTRYWDERRWRCLPGGRRPELKNSPKSLDVSSRRHGRVRSRLSHLICPTSTRCVYVRACERASTTTTPRGKEGVRGELLPLQHGNRFLQDIPPSLPPPPLLISYVFPAKVSFACGKRHF